MHSAQVGATVRQQNGDGRAQDAQFGAVAQHGRFNVHVHFLPMVSRKDSAPARPMRLASTAGQGAKVPPPGRRFGDSKAGRFVTPRQYQKAQSGLSPEMTPLSTIGTISDVALESQSGWPVAAPRLTERIGSLGAT